MKSCSFQYKLIIRVVGSSSLLFLLMRFQRQRATQTLLIYCWCIPLLKRPHYLISQECRYFTRIRFQFHTSIAMSHLLRKRKMSYESCLSAKGAIPMQLCYYCSARQHLAFGHSLWVKQGQIGQRMFESVRFSSPVNQSSETNVRQKSKNSKWRLR